MNRIISLRTFVSICLLFLTAAYTSFVQSQNSSSGEVDSATLQRILQYESVLGSELSTKVAICVDDAMGKLWIIGEDTSQDIRPSVLGNLRHASETCSVTMSSQKGRLAAQLREMTQRQLQLAIRLEQPVLASRICLKTASSNDAFESCISKAVGKLPNKSEMGFWNELIQRFTSQQGKL